MLSVHKIWHIVVAVVVVAAAAAIPFSGAVENFYTQIEMQFSRAAHFEIISRVAFNECTIDFQSPSPSLSIPVHGASLISDGFLKLIYISPAVMSLGFWPLQRQFLHCELTQFLKLISCFLVNLSVHLFL